jgi:hypothetical protein
MPLTDTRPRINNIKPLSTAAYRNRPYMPYTVAELASSFVFHVPQPVLLALSSRLASAGCQAADDVPTHDFFEFIFSPSNESFPCHPETRGFRNDVNL